MSDITTITLYLPSGIVYESKLYSNSALAARQKILELQFMGHEEGRIRFKPAAGNVAASLQYDYMIKDHLGNLRMVLTDEVKPAAIYQATIETNVRGFENELFNKIPDTEADKPTSPSPGFDSNGSNAKVVKLFNVSGGDKRIGPGVVLKVMAGDKINAKVHAWYPPSATDNTVYTGAPVLINGLINALSTGLLGAGSKGTLAELDNTAGVLNNPLTSFLTDPDRNYVNTKPKAYLNWILLDEQQFKYVDVDNNSGAAQILSIGSGEQKKLVQANGGNDITIARNGYIYVFVSNESQGAVYFDDLRVEHTSGQILEETHYYPFGLTMAGISSKAAGGIENKKKYNGYELNTDFDINLNESFYRSHDPQLGRFWQLDPKPDERISLYAAMGNNPISLNDLLGDTTRYFDNNNNLLYQTNVKGYNHATIVNDEQVGAFNKIVGGLGKLSSKQQFAFDWVAGFLNVGTTYDIGAMSTFYANEADKNTATKITGTDISSMENLKLDGKKVDPKTLKAEVSASLIIKNGVVTVGTLRQPNTDFATTNVVSGVETGYTGAHIHTHPNTVSGQYTWNVGAAHSYFTPYPEAGPSPGDQSRTSGDMRYHPVRNAVADKNYIYLINGTDKQTIKIPR